MGDRDIGISSIRKGDLYISAAPEGLGSCASLLLS